MVTTLKTEDTSKTRAKEPTTMSRVYVLVQTADGHSDDMASVLRRQPGVILADVVEGRIHVMMVVEAQHILKLAQLTIQALATVEAMTASVHLWPAQQRRAVLCSQR